MIKTFSWLKKKNIIQFDISLIYFWDFYPACPNSRLIFQNFSTSLCSLLPSLVSFWCEVLDARLLEWLFSPRSLFFLASWEKLNAKVFEAKWQLYSELFKHNIFHSNLLKLCYFLTSKHTTNEPYLKFMSSEPIFQIYILLSFIDQ